MDTSKRLSIAKHISTCGCCNQKSVKYQVMFWDNSKPGEPVTGRSQSSVPTPTRSVTACSPQHALDIMERFLREEGEFDA